MTGFIETMESREMVAQLTHREELIAHLKEKRTAYIGFDPTADSLHVGHLIPVMALRRFQQAGHRIIALMGGATAMVGDPTGKTEMRRMLSSEEINQRAEGFKKQLKGLIDLEDPEKGVILNNHDWLSSLSYVPFLREIGPLFSVNRMLAAECFKARLERGLSFLEFNYMILQGYDFYHLFANHHCTLQMGGDDQWSNMLAGMDLIRKKASAASFCLTLPLLVNAQGKKMGKTESGSVWLDPKLTSPYEFFQYFRNVDDGLVRSCLFYYTDLEVSEVERLSSLEGKEINEAKMRLAYEITRLIHGQKEADQAREAALALFVKDPAGGEAPKYPIDPEWFGESQGLIDLLAHAGLASSKSDIRRWILQGGISLNGQKVTDIKTVVDKKLISAPNGALIKRGKKHYYRLVFS